MAFIKGVTPIHRQGLASASGIQKRRLRHAAQIETRTCECGASFEAPVRMYTREVSAEQARLETLCANCILREFPARTCICANTACGKEFRVQAGEVRLTCSRSCKQSLSDGSVRRVVAQKTTNRKKPEKATMIV